VRPQFGIDQALGSASAWGRVLVRAGFLRPFVRVALDVHVHGVENLTGLAQPFIVVANHASHLDSALVYSFLPGRLSRRLSTGAAADHWFTSRTRSLLPRVLFNAFPVDRQGRSLRPRYRGLAQQLLRAGVPLLIFPEGTRSRDGRMHRFTPGAARLAVTNKVPCVPVAITGAWSAWPPTARLPRRLRAPVHITFGTPLVPRRGELPTAFNERVQATVRRLVLETGSRRRRPA